MSATITLKVVTGALDGAEFSYHGTGLIIIGRGHDCTVHIPNDAWYRNVSRHHCLLEIDPPQVRVCDLGSRNGTYVNGELIGRRDCDAGVDQLAIPSTPDHVLRNGERVCALATSSSASASMKRSRARRVPMIRRCTRRCAEAAYSPRRVDRL